VVDGERLLKFPKYDLEFSSGKLVSSAVPKLLSDSNVLKACQGKKILIIDPLEE
jgi:hypothetical protein